MLVLGFNKEDYLQSLTRCFSDFSIGVQKNVGAFVI